MKSTPYDCRCGVRRAWLDRSDVERLDALGATLGVDSAEIRIRAERRLGEMLKEQKDTVGLNKGTAVKGNTGGSKKLPPVVDDLPTLEQAGIDKKLSSRAQKLAAVPEEEFEQEIDEWRSPMQVGGNKFPILETSRLDLTAGVRMGNDDGAKSVTRRLTIGVKVRC
jgi:hypothetical protein